MRQFFWLFTSFLFLSSCTQYDKSELDNLNGDVRVIGHAGSGFTSWWPFNAMPGNSMASLKEALKNGADGLEVDVHMTSDGNFILYHDNKLESKTHLRGCPSAYPIDSLKGQAYKLDFPFSLFGEHELLALDDLILYLKSLDEFPELHLDLRNHSECEDEDWDKKWELELINRLKEKLIEWDIPEEKVILISYSRAMLNKGSRINMKARLSFEIVGEVESGIIWAKKHGIKIITIKPKLLTKELSKRLHQEGFEVITFGAKSKSGSKQLLELNPDVIQSNNVPALLSLLGRD